ncbi:LSD1-like protein [Hordeum vulgare]|nr:LSD1-like protein [Hordeum vulgare]
MPCSLRRCLSSFSPASIAGMQSQIVCHRCRRVLAYPSGAPSVCCAMCRAITAVPPPAPAVEMAQLICGGCRTLLMYTRNADTVRCSCCSTVNLVRPVNNIAHVNCGRCRTTLMYPHGAPSVKCAICDFITNTGINTMSPAPCPRPTSNESAYNASSASVPTSQPQNVTVVVENPMTVDEKGKLVSNVVVGITPGKN